MRLAKAYKHHWNFFQLFLSRLTEAFFTLAIARYIVIKWGSATSFVISWFPHRRSSVHTFKSIQVQSDNPILTIPFGAFKHIYKTRRYPWGIQRLVSTYSNCNPVLGSQNSKCQDLPKFLLGGGEVFCSSQNSKCHDLPKCQFGGGRILAKSKL